MSLNYLYVNNDTNLLLEGLQSDGSYLNAATVTWNLYAASDLTTSLANGTASYETASNGNYTATVASTVTATLTPGTYYMVKFNAAQSGADGDVWMECLAARYIP